MESSSSKVIQKNTTCVNIKSEKNITNEKIGTLMSLVKIKIADKLLRGEMSFSEALKISSIPGIGYSPNEMKRLVLAMAFNQVAFGWKAVLYGGFLRDLYSGAKFNDIDLYLESEYDLHRLVSSIPRLVSLLLGEEVMTITCTKEKESSIPIDTSQSDNERDYESVFDTPSLINYQSIVHTYKLCWNDIVVMVDLSIGNPLAENDIQPDSGGYFYHMQQPNMIPRPPATIGSSLQYDGNIISFKDPTLSSKYIIKMVLNLLSRGKDIKRILTLDEKKLINNELMIAYQSSKIDILTSRGYTFI